MVVVVVLSFYFGFGYTTQGYSPGVRKFGYTKITGGFLPVLALRKHLFIASSDFSFGDFQLALIQNKKKAAVVGANLVLFIYC